jgi:hypothetical protein
VPCLDENTLAALADGELDDSASADIEAHIDGCPRCADLVAAFGRVTRSASGLEPTAGEPLLGDRLGRYEIVGWLGRGAMGRVYVADDPGLERRVALKIVARAAAGAAELEARLAREARAMAQLSDHPNVVTVYDVGVAGERTFIAMELVEGTALESYLARRELDWRQILSLLLAAGRGLAAAHAASIVHRDFKPGNVLVGSGRRVKVGDFGLATAPIAGVGAVAATATSMAGTPAYMSPEQHRGEPATAASDQFGFAVTLWEALYGERPFAGRLPEEIRAAVLAGERRPPRRSAVPIAIARILERALAADAEARFPSLAAMLEALARAAGHRRRRWLTAAALAIAVLASGAITFASLTERAPRCPRPDDRLATVWGPGERVRVAATLSGAPPRHAAEIAARVLDGLDGYGHSWLAAHRRTCEATRVRHEQSEALLDLRTRCLERRLGDLGALAALIASDPALLERAPDAVAGLLDIESCTERLYRRGAAPLPADDPTIAAAAAAARAQQLTGRPGQAVRIGSAALARLEALESAADVELALIVAAAAEELGRHGEARDRYLAAGRAAARRGDDEAVTGAWIGLARVASRQGRGDDALAWAAAARREIARRGNPSDRQRSEIRALEAALRHRRRGAAGDPRDSASDRGRRR